MKSDKNKLLEIAGNIVSSEGFESLNMRRIAKEADISIGSVYNILQSKDHLIMLLINAYWEESIGNMSALRPNGSHSFLDNLDELYTEFKAITNEFHKNWIKDLVKIQMSNPEVAHMSSRYKNVVERHIYTMLLSDENISSQLDDNLNPEELSSFIFDYMMMLLKDNSNDLGFLKNIIVKMFAL